MSDDKVNVKDLADELNVLPRELLRILRKLNIPALSPKSLVAPEHLARVRAYFADAKTGEPDDRRESQPGVIVRRRRNAPEHLSSEASAEDADETPGDFVPTPEEKSDLVSEKPEPSPVAEASAEPVAVEPAPEEKAASVSEKPVPAEPVAAAAEPAAAEPRRTAEQLAQQESRPKRKRSSRQPVFVPAAKVISRPSDVHEEPEVAPAPVAVEAEELATAKAEVSPKAEAAPKVEAVPQTEAAPEPAADAPRRARPAASARPEGSSAPSLLPPVSERSQDGEERRERRPRRQEPVSSAPQVRVISRPDPSAQPRDTRESREGEGRGNRDFRSAPPRPGARPGGAPRPGGFAPQAPAGANNDSGREGQSKKKRNKNQNRRGADFQQNDTGLNRRRVDDDDMPRVRGRRRPKGKDARQVSLATQPVKAVKRKIRVEEVIRVADLAHQMGLKSGEIIKVLFGLGIMATINEALDIDTASVVASEFGYEVEKAGFVEEDYLGSAEADAPETLVRRPPVVTIMGHVDHGKTSLLDAIRKTNVTGGEAGGITQHIGAYYVKTRSGNIVFLDTPGHEAFTAMRARGAQVTDIVVLVVAADDGVMEQTREAVNHSRAAGVPIMVAVNKIDKPEANPERVLRELAEIGLVPEEWGGDTVVAKVSAKSGQGLDELLELLALQAEILDLKANPDKPARGHIVEAKLDKGRGPVATVLIQEGTLHQGDNFVCGVFSGRVRALFNDQGRKVKEAGPSCPVEVQGFDGVPEAGEEFICLTDEKLARRIAESRAVKQRERELAKESRVTLETFLAQSSDDEQLHTLNLVVKADVQGSLEAIVEALNKQSTDRVKIQVIHGGTGAITESDVLLASASEAIIIGFNVRPTAKVKEIAEHENVDIRFYDIIYKLVDEIKSAMAGLLAPVSREVYLGQADVRKVYSVPKVGSVAGCLVSDGKVTRGAGVRLLRDSVVVHTGKLASLKRFKDDAREVLKGYECGMSLENFNDIKVGDVFEFFDTVTEAATL